MALIGQVVDTDHWPTLLGAGGGGGGGGGAGAGAGATAAAPLGCTLSLAVLGRRLPVVLPRSMGAGWSLSFALCAAISAGVVTLCNALFGGGGAGSMGGNGEAASAPVIDAAAAGAPAAAPVPVADADSWGPVPTAVVPVTPLPSPPQAAKTKG